jgi:hypothetical protein
VRETLVAAAALASPIVSLVVALVVTSRTISNDRLQRTLDRSAERRKQLHDRQLDAAAELTQAAHAARIAVVRVDPSDVDHGALLPAAETAVQEARLALGRVQLLFPTPDQAVANAAEAVVDSIASAYGAARRAHVAGAELATSTGGKSGLLERLATAQADYAETVRAAEENYRAFTDAAAITLGSVGRD